MIVFKVSIKALFRQCKKIEYRNPNKILIFPRKTEIGKIAIMAIKNCVLKLSSPFLNELMVYVQRQIKTSLNKRIL